eukprot:NODE_2644_length_528_cov_62.551122_g2594_i0.p1 GENE.NODE_2644_length_528_cov_62.551122_g2594_i0~~NODE_2644_length_528_cov_62.551122_g2594_i0.p1  ORF type:complete len:125 (+),score=16.24 NODE_2644_length_528_cov_62.551122_g2594_i0:60-434(+)
MSWQAYVDQQLVGTGHVTKAAILGHDGSQWAATAGFSVSEGKQLAAQFANPNSAFSEGIKVAGVKYMTIKADQRSIYGKKGAGGCVCVKTNQAILVGMYDENIQPGQCTTVVEKLADYLIENNY